MWGFAKHRGRADLPIHARKNAARNYAYRPTIPIDVCQREYQNAEDSNVVGRFNQMSEVSC